jgi:membrane-associated PAP2 superfamily phosphatase
MRRDLWWTVIALLALALWESSRLDMTLARWFGDAQGFSLRHDWLLDGVLHSKAVNLLGWLIGLALLAGVWRPFGWLRRLDLPARAQLALTPLLATAAVGLIKRLSTTSCPWDLNIFGGSASYIPHWPWLFGAADGGGGHCFPAGHSSFGFVFVGGWFAFRERAPRLAAAWLAAALLAGLIFGLSQQARGAHFMSHTFWTAWICWSIALLADWAARTWRARRRLA